MTPLYEVWQALPGSQIPNGEWQSWGSCWEGYEKIQLPLPWAKAYAAELAELFGLPTEVRGTGKNYRKIKAVFGMEVA